MREKRQGKGSDDMNILKKLFENTRKPEKGLGGGLILWMMNVAHSRNAAWGLEHLDIPSTAHILDIGCGGGKNIARLLHRANRGKVYGIDYSRASVDKSTRVNKTAVAEGRTEIFPGSVSSLPFDADKFDVVTAFETVYFWPDLLNDFKEVGRVLKKGGAFLICNEVSRPEGFQKWSDMLKMTIYTKEELSDALDKAGFYDISCDVHKNGKWLRVTALNRG